MASKKSKNTKVDIPPGFKLLFTLRGHTHMVLSLAWAPDGQTLASGSSDSTIRLWNASNGKLRYALQGNTYTDPIYSLAWAPDGQTLASSSRRNIWLWDASTGQLRRALRGHTHIVRSLAWAPDGQTLASGSSDNTIRLWDASTGQLRRALRGHTHMVLSLAWAPDGQTLASGSSDNTIRLWDASTGQLRPTLRGHTHMVLSLAWAPDGQTLASGSSDNTIRLWDASTGKELHILEGHTGSIGTVSFSPKSPLLASKSSDGTIRIWHTDTWKMVATLEESHGYLTSGIDFHPTTSTLATTDTSGVTIRIWDLDPALLLGSLATLPSTRYTNAKVVLVGDSGVGKSGLGLVLTGQPFVATESSHGRRVWIFDRQEVPLSDGGRETRETLLWDLAGQPGYRLIHQLHLNEVAVALIVFDSRNETDPFAGVHHWCRALRLAQRLTGPAASAMKKFLVAARTDRGGRGVSHLRIDAVLRELELDGFFETSAKEGLYIAELAAAIQDAIDWESLPKVSSTDLFERIKTFLVAEKEAGRLLPTADDLYATFLRAEPEFAKVEALRAQIETCIGRVESRGLIRRLSFGDLVLLQPELLDAYASALVNFVKDEPEGLGSIVEEQVRRGEFPLSREERLANKQLEKLLLLAMIEDLLRNELALREQAEDGPHLVFPSQSTRQNPDLPDPEGKTLIFHFDGPVQNIYATLAVRLSHSGLFQKRELWKDAVAYSAKVGGKCGIFLRNQSEGRGELVVFFDAAASEETRFHFEDYIHTHLLRSTLPGSLKRERIFACSVCSFIVSEQLVQIRKSRHLNWITCPGCEQQKIWLLDREERLAAAVGSRVPEMDRAADIQRDWEAAKSMVQGKIATRDFDVFLSYRSTDKPEVKKIAERLKERGILPWLDEWELRPGMPWQRLLEEQIVRIKSVAVFIGKDGIGKWQQEELETSLSEFVVRACPVIPVLLPNSPKETKVPPFLKNRTWVDFRQWDPDPLECLIWGITGERALLA